MSLMNIKDNKFLSSFENDVSDWCLLKFLILLLVKKFFLIVYNFY
jgi:hypothetical protein